MTTYYVGSGGNDSNAGTSWSARKLTLTGAEDIPVVAGDTVYVGPGVYREQLTCDVSGSSGSPITYIGDVTGEHTDGVGGVVRVTGSDDDQSATRSYIVYVNGKDYRTFKGFSFDTNTNHILYSVGSDNLTITDCFFDIPGQDCVFISGANQHDIYIARCFFKAKYNRYGVVFYHSSAVDDTSNLVENCIFLGNNYSYGVAVNPVGGVTVRNCYFATHFGVRVSSALTAGQSMTVHNCIFEACYNGVYATTTSEFVEDANCFYLNYAARTNVSPGASSNTYPVIQNPPIFLEGFKLPWFFGELSQWSPLRRIAGTSAASDDLFGIARPATSSKLSWGPIQYTGAIRDTTTTYGSSAASLKLPDAAELFLMRLPVSAVSTTISVKVYREPAYAGTNPQMILRQAGQSDRTATDTGSASAWNTLTDTFTPASAPGWLDIFVVSHNTATSGSYAVYFDNVSVS